MNIVQRYINHLKLVWSQPSKGFGDTFAKITKSLGITPCDKCETRRKSWNEKLAYEKEKRSK
jgi:hypothetical protein